MIDKITPRVFSSDQDQRLTTSTQYVDALNINIDTDEDGNNGIIKNCKGTNEIPNPIDALFIEPGNGAADDTPDTVTLIGSCRDNERGRTYLFIHSNVATRCGVFYYEDSSRTVKTVLLAGQLNWTASSKISANVINGEFRGDGEVNSLLYFTDDRNEPRKINVDRISELSGLGNTDRNLYTEVLKQSPLDAPTAHFGFNESLGVARMSIQSAYQFAFQYIYKDGEISALSPISQSYLPARSSDDLYPNYAQLTLPHIRFARNTISPVSGLNKEVKKVRVLYREEAGAEISPFRILDEYDPTKGIYRTIGTNSDFPIAPANSNTYIFLDRGYQSILPTDQEDTPFSAVPRRAKSQTISNSRVFYGNYLEGFNNLGSEDGVDGDSGDAPDVNLTVNYSDVSSAGDEQATLIVNESAHNVEGLYINNAINISQFPSNYINGDVVDVKIDGLISASIENDTTILDRVGITATKTNGDPLYAINIGSNLFPNLKSIKAQFNTKGVMSLITCSPDEPIQYAIPISGSYTKAQLVDAMNAWLETNPITRTKTVTLSSSNVDSDSFRLLYNDTFTKNGVTYAAGSTFDEDLWTNFPSLQNLVDNGVEEFYGWEVEISYETKVKFFQDGNEDTLRFALIPHNVSVVGFNPDVFLFGVESYNPHGPVTDGGVDEDGDNIASYSLSNVDSDNCFIRSSVPVSISGFTAGSNHSFAFEYFDSKGRVGNAQEVGSVYVEPIGSSERQSGSTFLNGPASITVNPLHEPPNWACGYRILYAGPDDIKDKVDLFIDYPTKVIKETKFFPTKRPDTVFLKISGYVENLRKDGIDFNSIYNVEAGDILRVVSKRKVSPAGNYTAGNGTGNGMSNPHRLTNDGLSYYSQLTNEGKEIDFVVVSLVEISENTSVDDYPFLLNPDGTVDGGIFLEVKVPPSKALWGKNYILSLGELVGDIPNPWVSSDDFAYNRPNYVTYIQGENGYTEDGSNWKFRAYREIYNDDDQSASIDGESIVRYLFNPGSGWDKGVRAQILKPQQRTASKVYHAITGYNTLEGRTDVPHGDAVKVTNGFARYRQAFEFNPSDFGTDAQDIEVLPGADGDGADSGSRSFGGSAFSAKPEVGSETVHVESHRASYGSLVKANHIGKLNVSSSSASESRRENSIIHSAFQGSETLNLALHDFKSTNFKDLDVNNGAINALLNVPQHLMALQASKVSKIPVSRSIIATAGGDNNLTVSNTVMGPERSYSGNYGLDTDISAAINVDGVVYFIDKGRRSIIKISGDGFTPISDIAISSDIEKTFGGDLIRNLYVGYDKDTKEVLFTFDKNNDNSKTFAYSHKKNQWLGRYSFIPAGYAETENSIISVRQPEMVPFEGFDTYTGNVVHVHDNEEEFARFYGANYSSKISVVSTGKNPSQVKVYNAIGLESNAPMDVEVSNSDQRVSFSDARFAKKERSYYTDLPFDGSHLDKVFLYLKQSASAQIISLPDETKNKYVRAIVHDLGIAEGVITANPSIHTGSTEPYPFLDGNGNEQPLNGRSYTSLGAVYFPFLPSNVGGMVLPMLNVNEEKLEELKGTVLPDVSSLGTGDNNMTGESRKYIVVVDIGGRWIPIHAFWMENEDSTSPIDVLNFSRLFNWGQSQIPLPAVGGQQGGSIDYGSYVTTYAMLQLTTVLDTSIDGAESVSLPGDPSVYAYWSSLMAGARDANPDGTVSQPFKNLRIGLASLEDGDLGDTNAIDLNDRVDPLTLGGKKIRDHYARIDLTSAGDGKKFELYAINLDFDDSKIHM